MALHRPPSPGGPHTVLVFGPQALSFDLHFLKRLRSAVSGRPDRAWILEAIAGLPGCWETFADAFPKFNTDDGLQQLRHLHDWFENGAGLGDLVAAASLPNLLLSPLVVISQIVDFLEHTDGTYAAPQAGVFEPPPGTIATIGLCTGILGALAVALSNTTSSLRDYGARSMRIAMLIGGVVDTHGRKGLAGQWQALATAWSTAETQEEMKRVLASFPEAYVSVHYDDNRVTVTAPAATTSALQRELRAVGVVTSEIGLRGSFHHPSHREDADLLSRYCDRNPSSLALPEHSHLVHPILFRPGDTASDGTALHTHAVKAILVEQSHWVQTFRHALNRWADSEILVLGPERCVPPSLATRLGSKVAYSTPKHGSSRLLPDQGAGSGQPRPRKPDDIAVVGMSVKVAGADDTEEFWDLLRAGKSQHQEVPRERITFESPWREPDPDRRWFGNFVNNHDTFDHKFFKKTAREVASADPQHRQMLQAAYQAVAQSGYFDVGARGAGGNVGCFIGSCTGDYENNVACHAPTAFTAVGNLRSFTAGKISHFFGWTGPSVCLDTACSSSCVAVHQACQSILAGECDAALAGGTNIVTHSLWFQNLAAASFLSPTGQCKPFDAGADGYCRGEGVAAVYLKRMSTAIADGDLIFGTIAGTSVMQNNNCTPIVVPSSPSLAELFVKVLHRAQLAPHQIGYVEAHGTGTQVGDPAEYQSIRDVVGGRGRARPLSLGSVKGLVGHTEGASGIVSLAKSLLMLHHKAVPPQSSFATLNPHIPALPTDNIHIAAAMAPWEAEGQLRAVLINNYGASGSNASMVVTESPVAHLQQRTAPSMSDVVPGTLVRIEGPNDAALMRYVNRLVRFLQNREHGSCTVADVAFNLSRQCCNISSERVLAFSCRSMTDLMSSLGEVQDGRDKSSLFTPPAQRPVILCFGGQVNTYVGLDRGVYETALVFRRHLDECDSVCRSLGTRSLFPDIFSEAAVEDVVQLQTMLFASQYASARSWMDCGVRPAALVGHSFGELTALCVAGALTLSDALRMIIGRASLIRDSWGDEKGSMLAIQASQDEVDCLLAEARQRSSQDGHSSSTIACVNGPQSFTLAGSSKSIDSVAGIIASDARWSSLRCKRLNVTHAFHSALVESLKPQLLELGKQLSFHAPLIPVETATQSRSRWAEIFTPSYVAEHLRNPVYFHQATQRLSEQYPAAIWLEAGSNSTITNMASRALGSPTSSFFQSVNIGGSQGTQQIASATLNLWKAGLPHVPWRHHRCQTYKYAPLLLPPYQFETTRHWMDYKMATRGAEATPLGNGTAIVAMQEEPQGLWDFVKWKDPGQRHALFRINTHATAYRDMVSGHVIAHTAPICPATVELDIVIEALMSVRQGSHLDMQPRVQNVTNQAAICHSPGRSVWLDMEATDNTGDTWTWRFTSDEQRAPGTSTVLHAAGQVVFIATNDETANLDFASYQRLVSHDCCLDLLDRTVSSDDVIQGRGIYRTFSPVVDYGPAFQGLQRLVGRGNHSAGRVVAVARPPTGATWLDAHLSDSFCQVGGIWVNCMNDCDPGDLYLATGIGRWIRSPQMRQRPATRSWDILASHHVASKQTVLTDIFVFESSGGSLVEVILGIKYHKVAKASMSRLLSKLASSDVTSAASATTHAREHTRPAVAMPEKNHDAQIRLGSAETAKQPPAMEEASRNVTGKIRALIADISGLESNEIADDAQLADIGIDSLMGMEVARELGGLFDVSLSIADLDTIVDFRGLVDYMHGVLGLAHGEGGAGDDETSASSVKSEGHSEGGQQNGLVSPPSSDGGLPDQADGDCDGQPQLTLQSFQESFRECKSLTDETLAAFNCTGYADVVLPEKNELCVALAVEAFEEMGCPLSTASPGDALAPIQAIPKQRNLADYLCRVLQDVGLVVLDGSTMTRTAAVAPADSSETILARLLDAHPGHESAARLTHFTGRRLADVLRGECDGIQLIFGSQEGRELVAGLYGDFLLNQVANAQMGDLLRRLAAKMRGASGPLRIMEVGAGTGGTTVQMAQVLAGLGIPVKYTFTDLSGSFVAAARKRFKQYPFMEFRAHDIEKPPPDDLCGSQHVVLASNAIHATHSLVRSCANIRKALRPDGGLLVMMEMTQPLYWVDMIFGLFDGWWLFDDGRDHAVAPAPVWDAALRDAGYTHVDWTDGRSPESKLERVIAAYSSASSR